MVWWPSADFLSWNSFVALLANDEADYELQSLAATIIGSLAHGAPPPTLLSLCRAHTTEALLISLERLSRLLAEDYRGTLSPSFAANIKLIESLLRALRALLMALADEVSPGTKWERGLGMTSRLDSAATSHFKGRPLAALGKSHREIVGWHIADAGFEADGDTKMSLSSAAMPSRSKLSPREELTLLARKSINYAFSKEAMPFWLGTLFIARLPMMKTVHAPTSSAVSSVGNSRASTRPASPMLSATAVVAGLSRSSSRLSYSSLQQDDRSSPPSRPDTPIMSNQVRLLSITEMVFGILSSCLDIAGDEAEIPAKGIARRRTAVLDFAALDSPFWLSVSDEHRGRQASVDVPDEAMQASFVKRGKSTDESKGEARYDAKISIDGDDGVASAKSVLDVLLEATECGYTKTQEAALWALTDLSRENTDTSRRLFTCSTPSGLIPTSMLLNLRKDSSAPIRLAAFCCLAHIIKVHPFTPRTNECVLSVLAELLDFSGDVQVAAMFALARLLADDTELQLLACEQYDCIDKLAKLLEKSKNMPIKVDSAESAVDDHSARLREAALTALAALCFQRDDIRRRLVDYSTPSLLPLIIASLSASQVGVRIAACRLVRGFSRSTSILRTSLVDAGVAAKLLAILHDKEEEELVKVEATATVCNLVLNFSPMKQVLLDGGGIDKLVEMAKSSYGPSKLNALWALKNILYSSDAATKTTVMTGLGWEFVLQLACGSAEGEDEVQEQALNIIRNLCSSREADIDAALKGFGGGQALMDLVECVIWQRKSDNVLEQAAFIIVNIATGSEEHRKLIINRPNLLDALVFFLNHPRAEIREAGIWAVTNLTQGTNRGGPREMKSGEKRGTNIDHLLHRRIP